MQRGRRSVRRRGRKRGRRSCRVIVKEVMLGKGVVGRWG